MRTLAVVCLISFLPLTTYAALSTGAPGAVSSEINIPTGDAVTANTSFLQSIDPGKAAGLNVVGATGGLVHPACMAETARRAAMNPPQPPPMGDFPCIVPASNGAGIVDGVCFVKVCKGIASTGLDGLLSALGGISSLGSIVSGILGKLMQSSSQPSNENNATIPQAVEAPPSTSALITTGAYQPLDMPKLFNDSAIIVRDLLFALNP